MFQKCLICCVSEWFRQTTLIALVVTTQKPLIGYFSYLETRKNNTYLLISTVLIKLLFSKDPMFLEKYWYYFHSPKNVLFSILSFVFWIFPHLDTAVQSESADSKQNAISKYLFQDMAYSLWHIFWAMRRMHHTFWKKATFRIYLQSGEIKKK